MFHVCFTFVSQGLSRVTYCANYYLRRQLPLVSAKTKKTFFQSCNTDLCPVAIDLQRSITNFHASTLTRFSAARKTISPLMSHFADNAAIAASFKRTEPGRLGPGSDRVGQLLERSEGVRAQQRSDAPLRQWRRVLTNFIKLATVL